MADFSKSVKGESVYCLIWGEGEIERVMTVDGIALPISVKFPSGMTRNYTDDGRYFPDGNRVLFHSKPQIIEPKRKVKKTFTKWINLYTDGLADQVHETEAKAIDVSIGESTFIKTVPITVEVEVEVEE